MFKKKQSKYGFFNLVGDIIAIPFVVMFWIIEKIFDCFSNN